MTTTDETTDAELLRRMPWKNTLCIYMLGVVLQALFLPCLCFEDSIKMSLAGIIDVLVAIRLGVAYLRREQGAVWVFYSWFMFLSAAIVWVVFDQMSQLAG